MTYHPNLVSRRARQIMTRRWVNIIQLLRCNNSWIFSLNLEINASVSLHRLGKSCPHAIEAREQRDATSLDLTSQQLQANGVKEITPPHHTTGDDCPVFVRENRNKPVTTPVDDSAVAATEPVENTERAGGKPAKKKGRKSKKEKQATSTASDISDPNIVSC